MVRPEAGAVLLTCSYDARSGAGRVGLSPGRSPSSNGCSPSSSGCSARITPLRYRGPRPGWLRPGSPAIPATTARHLHPRLGRTGLHIIDGGRTDEQGPEGLW